MIHFGTDLAPDTQLCTVPLTKGYGSGWVSGYWSWYFLQRPSRWQLKNIIFSNLFLQFTLWNNMYIICKR
jgi:hypothetical protein